MQISRNKEATKKASRKIIHDSFLKTFMQKDHFLPKIGGTTKTSYKS